MATHSKGYVLVKMKDHHRMDTRGYVFEHILVMEKAIGRRLEKFECVHHKDENKKNNSIENLHLCKDNKEHRRIHMKMNAIKECGNPEWRKCTICRQYDDPKNLYINKNHSRHRECWRKFYQKNREQFNEWQRIRREKKSESTMAHCG